MTTRKQTAYEKIKGSEASKPFPPALAKLRQEESTRRSLEARRRALVVLRTKYLDEYNDLREKEREAIDAARGPLPTKLPRGKK